MGRPRKTAVTTKNNKVVAKKTKKKNIFILTSVHDLSKAELRDVTTHINNLGDHKIVLSSSIVKNEADPMKFFLMLKKTMDKADEIHVFYNPKSRSTNMLLGLALGLKKKLVYPETTAKSYSENWKTVLVPNVVVNSTSETLEGDRNNLIIMDDVITNPNDSEL